MEGTWKRKGLSAPRNTSTKTTAIGQLPSPGGDLPPLANCKDVRLVFLNQDRKFLCRQASQLGNSFYVLLNSFCCRQKPHLTLFVSSQCLSFFSLPRSSSLSSHPTPSSAPPHGASAQGCLGWTFNPGMLPTPSTEPAFAPGI